MYGDALRQATQFPTNQWLRNIKTYLDALQDDALDDLKINEIRADGGPVDMDKMLAKIDSLESTGYGAGLEREVTEAMWNDDEQEVDKDLEGGVEEEVAGHEDYARVLKRDETMTKQEVLL